MSVDNLTDEQRRARALTIDQVAEKIRREYGPALAALGMFPVVQRVWDYTVAEHVEFARQRGVTLDPNAQQIQRDYLDLLRSASTETLNVVAATLLKMLDFDRLRSTDHVRLTHELIAALSHVETLLEMRKEREIE